VIASGERSSDCTPSGFLVLRTPLLPLEAWLAWSATPAAVAALARDDQTLAAALDADRARLRQHLILLVGRPEIREAIVVASPDLDGALASWIATPASATNGRVERALARYLARAATRATPFGLFATWATAQVGGETRLTLGPLSAARRYSRLDTSYLTALAEAAARDPPVRAALRYLPNQTLYRTADRVRYVERRPDGDGRAYYLVSLDDDDTLRRTLERAAAGATIDDLAAAVRGNDAVITPQEAYDYVHSLIDHQVVVSDLEPPMTGGEPGRQLASRLAALEPTRHLGQRLTSAIDELSAIDNTVLGAATEQYRAFSDLLATLPAGADRSTPWHVDLCRPSADATLGADAIALMRRGVTLLHRLCPPPPEDELTRLASRVAERYGQRAVPLVEVLDEDCGIGFGGQRPGRLTGQDSWTNVRWGPRERLLLDRVTEMRADGARAWNLTESDLRELEHDARLPLPDAFAAIGTFFSSLAGGRPRDLRLLLTAVVGPSGATMLGRFCHADQRLCRLVEAHLRAEEALHPEAIFAEIVHLPDDRAGNVVARPALRAWDLTVHGRSGLPPERQVPVTDLLLSHEDGRLVLRSRRLGCRVHPRLTSAHDFTGRTLGLYRFLCRLQGAYTASSLAWDWGPLGDAACLPRVTCGPLVLARARWHLAGEALKPLGRMNAPQQFRLVQAWREARHWPRFVLLADADNLLPIDLDDGASVDELVHQLGSRNGASLVEMLPDTDQLIVEGPDGRYTHEVIVPFTRLAAHAREDCQPIAVDVRHRDAAPADAASRAVLGPFLPGSEWLFAKLYAGPGILDRVLVKAVAPVVREAIEAATIDRWFFVRYGDPEWHLRLRLHGDPAVLARDVRPALQAIWDPLVAAGTVWRVQLDTYDPEMERYGGAAALPLVEGIFQADSEAVISILERLEPGDEGQTERWRLAFRGVDQLLGDLQLDPASRHAVIARNRQGFPPAGGFTRDVRRQLAARLRKGRPDIEAVLDRARDAPSPLAPGLEAFERRSRALAPIVSEWHRLQRPDAVQSSLIDVAGSLVHMHLNRLLADGRQDEPIVYDLLGRVYASQAARTPGGRRGDPMGSPSQA
jgi:thiopeptide-type bacteriocin biosynthesis protein